MGDGFNSFVDWAFVGLLFGFLGFMYSIPSIYTRINY